MCTLQKISPLLETKPKDLSHGMRIYRIQSAPLSFKVSATIPFPPSAFGGTGEEERQGIVLSIPDEVYERIHNLGEGLKAQLSETHPDIASKWSSPLKAATEKYAANLRAKINVKGDKACQFYDMDASPTKAPERWRGLEVNAVIRLGGVYVQSRGAGMLLDVTHLQYDPAANSAQNPFA